MDANRRNSRSRRGLREYSPKRPSPLRSPPPQRPKTGSKMKMLSPKAPRPTYRCPCCHQNNCTPITKPPRRREHSPDFPPRQREYSPEFPDRQPQSST